MGDECIPVVTALWREVREFDGVEAGVAMKAASRSGYSKS